MSMPSSMTHSKGSARNHERAGCPVLVRKTSRSSPSVNSPQPASLQRRALPPGRPELVALSYQPVTCWTLSLLHLSGMEHDEVFDAPMQANGVADALRALRYSSVVEVIDEVIEFNPAATVADVRQYAASRSTAAHVQLKEAEARIERAVCQHCDVNIVRGSDGTWYHGRSPSWGSRGCRAYSSKRLGTWDDTLDGGWTATPA